MKNFSLLLLLLILGAGAAQAQKRTASEPKNLIKVAPLGVVNKIRVQYERVLTDNISAGLIGSAYYAVFPGVKGEVFGRYYLMPNAPEGLYLQGKAMGGRFTSRFGYVTVTEVYGENGEITDVRTSADEVLKKRKFNSAGAGAGIGYQALLGEQKRLSLDVSVGAQYLHFTKEDFTFREVSYHEKEKHVTSYTPDFADVLWHKTGPGSYFNGMFTVGYRF